MAKLRMTFINGAQELVDRLCDAPSLKGRHVGMDPVPGDRVLVPRSNGGAEVPFLVAYREIKYGQPGNEIVTNVALTPLPGVDYTQLE